MRRKAQTWGLALAACAALVLGVLLVAGCGGGGDEFPTGQWATTGCALCSVFDYRSDGTFTYSSLDSLKVVSFGTYSTTEDTFTFETDTGCKERNPDTEKGTYSWRLENDQLTFTAQEDPCIGRRLELDGPTLSPVE